MKKNQKKENLTAGIVLNDEGNEVYEASYDGYWRWCEDAGNVQMVEVLREYSEIENLRKKMKPVSDSAFALGYALHDIRRKMFDRISIFVSCKAGQERMKKRLSGILNDLWQARNLSEPSAPRTPRSQAAKTATARPDHSREDKGSTGSHKRGRAEEAGTNATRGAK